MAFDEMELDTIWFDGSFVDWSDATIHVLSHALHYGTAVFEGVRCYDTPDGPAIFRWEEHLERLYRSAAPYDLDIAYEPETLTDATVELIKRHELESCYVRPIVFYGYHSLGISPRDVPTRVAIACWPWGSYLGEDAHQSGVDVMVSSWRKFASSQMLTTAKTSGTYINSFLAGEEARRNGYAEAIVLNKEGNVAEGPGENVFLVRDGQILTPGISEGILDGITRNTVIQLARDLGYPVDDTATISRGELYNADELFFTGTAAEVTPIRRVDNVRIGNGGRGDVTEEIQSKYFDVVNRRTNAYDDWFTFV